MKFIIEIEWGYAAAPMKYRKIEKEKKEEVEMEI